MCSSITLYLSPLNSLSMNLELVVFLLGGWPAKSQGFSCFQTTLQHWGYRCTTWPHPTFYMGDRMTNSCSHGNNELMPQPLFFFFFLISLRQDLTLQSMLASNSSAYQGLKLKPQAAIPGSIRSLLRLKINYEITCSTKNQRFVWRQEQIVHQTKNPSFFLYSRILIYSSLHRGCRKFLFLF